METYQAAGPPLEVISITPLEVGLRCGGSAGWWATQQSTFPGRYFVQVQEGESSLLWACVVPYTRRIFVSGGVSKDFCRLERAVRALS